MMCFKFRIIQEKLFIPLGISVARSEIGSLATLDAVPKLALKL